jgi:hypothetical protein
VALLPSTGNGKAVSCTYSECVSVALIINMQSTCPVPYCHVWPLPLFSTLSHKGHFFKKKMFLNKKCVFFSLQLVSLTFLTLRRIQQDTFVNVHVSSCTIPVFLSDFNKI